MKDEKHLDDLEREETISDLELPEGEAAMVKGGSEIYLKVSSVSGLSVTKRIDKSSPRV